MLAINASDPVSGQTAVSRKVFSINKPRQSFSNLPMTAADIKKYRDQIKYIASQQEMNEFDATPNETKTAFLIQFWESRDETPETPDNEFMMDYFSRFNYAEKNFKGIDAGSNSDMGRVFIVYGQPDDIERYQMDFQTKPYEIWQYYTTGGKHVFYFVDRNNIGIYSLVHSTVLEEIKNYSWRENEL